MSYKILHCSEQDCDEDEFFLYKLNNHEPSIILSKKQFGINNKVKDFKNEIIFVQWYKLDISVL